MIGNLKVTDKLIELAKEHPKTTLMGTLAFVTAVILAFTLPGGSKTEAKAGDVRPPAIEEKVHQEEEQVIESPKAYSGYDITIQMGTDLTLEPNGKYVGKVRVSDQAELVFIDGDYALVLYNVPQEKYNYDLSHDHRRLGYVPLDAIKPLSNHMSESATTYDRYVCFDKATRIRNEMGDGGILTTAKQGDYARVIGVVFGPEWSDEEWYIVAYGEFIGYMEGRNGTFISNDDMIEIINTPNIYLRITGTDVNLRGEPEKNKKNVKTHLNKGDEALVLDHQNGWYHVIYNGIEGYISDELTCLEEYRTKKIPNGLENLHFENSSEKTI